MAARARSAVLLCYALALLVAPACSIPVFRFALERWDASPYELFVFHRGKLADDQQAHVAALRTRAALRERQANVTVRTVDLEASPSPDLLALWRQQNLETPALVLRYPQGSVPGGEVWAGPLSETTIQQVLDSPVRRRLAERLIEGDSGVWVLLETGDKAQDDAAAQLLQTRLEHLEKTLKLPTIESDDVAKYEISGAAELKVAFSILRLARSDRAEEVFVRMLLRSEDDLDETHEPMAFPIFGRGRVLFALVGKGINHEMIDEACSFLIGPCSCIVKELNPGQDLLVAGNWGSVARMPTAEETERAALLTRSEPEIVPIAPGAAPKLAEAEPVQASTNDAFLAAAGQPGSWRGVLLLVTGLGAVLAFAGVWVLWRRRA